MMSLKFIWRSVFYSIVIGCLLLTGCAGKKSKEVKLQEIVQEQEEEVSEAAVDIEAIIQEAEAHYEKGYIYYKDHQWVLAEQEFDQAIETLLNADVDGETHYKLGKAYNRLFYNIHKLELEDSYLRGLLTEQLEEAEQDFSGEEGALSQQASQEPSALENTPQEASETTDTLGKVSVDLADPDIQKYAKEISQERSQYRAGIERAGQYLPMMEEIFRSYNLPTELIYMPLIESNYRVDAVSPTGATGLWQFVRSTAKIYGLRVDSWVDERRDPEKSTHAAAKYLRDLYQMLGCWDLAMSGYYMGEYKVHNAIGKYRTRDITQLAGTKSFGQGAKEYVSRIKAAIVLASNPEEYGVNFQQTEPIPYDTIEMKRGIQLQSIAQQCNITSQQLKTLNPELQKTVIPPGGGVYVLKVPAGMRNLVFVEQSETPIPTSNTVQLSQVNDRTLSSAEVFVYTVARGDTLAKIAKQYGIDFKILQQVNNISNAKNLQVGQNIKIPISDVMTDMIVYRIVQGDTLAKIARQYGVNVEILQKINNITDSKKLQIGQNIKIPTAGSGINQGPEIITHIVKKGETLSSIARLYKVDVTTVMAYNSIQNAKKLQIGQTLKIPLPPRSVLAKNENHATSEKREITYRVKQGDSLSKIASTFGVTIRQLKEWNQFVQGTVIYPGNRIKVLY